ncbi:hypothetical protein LRH25_15335 [Ideonella azotifigens]|uniref:Uncharacterized protein n=1 Tax=Ideonella azotifigens TaxID=513160 RepID=A0ABN1K1I0_9BURK|nr:hypothetical protein [Ideonella azotifigens]MCD2341717.1 hypothetical protein [Ideonella azotifigens]
MPKTFRLAFCGCAAALALIVSAPVIAQTSEVMLQNATTYSIGNTVYFYGLPTRVAADGTVKYWDGQIVLQADDTNGKPNKASMSGVVKSPNVKKSEFVPGTYAFGGATCKLVASPFAGRTEYELDCADSSGRTYIGVFYSGPVSGNPYETKLKAAKLDLVAGVDEYAWGATSYTGNLNWFTCFNDGELLSARQNGNTLTLINWGYDNVEDCRVNLIKQ